MMGKTINIKYFSAKNMMPTMVLSGSKRSIVTLGRVLFTLAKCEYTKETLRAMLRVKPKETIRILIKQAKTEKELKGIDGDSHGFNWSLTPDKWKDFSSLIARFRGGKIDHQDIDPTYYNNLDLMISLGNSY